MHSVRFFNGLHYNSPCFHKKFHSYPDFLGDEVKMLAVERVKIQFGNGEIQLDATIQKLIQTAMRVLNK